MIEVKIIEDSIHSFGKFFGNGDSRITTLQLRYHRYIHAEVMTHRVFSRSASSSRAIPIQKIISEVWNNPATPLHWGQNICGMQAKTELTGLRLILAKFVWKSASRIACILAFLLYKFGLHKQIGNRILEPFSFINVILTSTDFDNFFELRIHRDAQPEIQQLAIMMKKAMDNSIPKILKQGEWHLPYITNEERTVHSDDVLLKCSTARCARVSYNNHDGSEPSILKDVQLHDRLVGSIPLHASPAEHQASPSHSKVYIKNFKGWQQYRTTLENTIFNKR
jgi:hypothetical protein